MTRRWLIRILFLLPILLTLTAWTWSTTHETYGAYYLKNNNGIGLEVYNGIFEVIIGRIDGFEGWLNYNIPIEFHPLKGQSLSDLHSLFNFGYAHQSDIHIFVIPLWFLLIFFSLLFLLVYRKTRPKPNPQTAFPVQLAPAAPTHEPLTPK